MRLLRAADERRRFRFLDNSRQVPYFTQWSSDESGSVLCTMNAHWDHLQAVHALYEFTSCIVFVAPIALFKTSSNCRAILDQSYRAASAAAVRSYLRRSCESRRSVMMLSPKLLASSAKMQFSPLVTSSPSAPMVVDTTALPIAMASKILSRVPPPIRSGTITTAASRK